MSYYKTGMNAFNDMSLSLDSIAVSGLLVRYLNAASEEDIELGVKRIILDKMLFEDFLQYSSLDVRESIFFMGKMFPKVFNDKICKQVRMNVSRMLRYDS